MGNPMQNQTDAMTPNELLKCYYRMDTKRQTQLLAYAVELREERHTERHTAKRPLGRRHEDPPKSWPGRGWTSDDG
jgi:hypothetical protein